MQVSVLTENLQKKVTLLSHAISSKNQLPVLQNLLLLAKEGKLRLAATDLEIGIQTDTPASVEEEGGVTIPARSFIELIGSLPPGKATFTSHNGTLNVTSTRVKSGFQTMPTDEFPKLYEEKGRLVASLTKADIEEKLGRVIFAASTDPARPGLTGILLKFEKNGMLFVATDAFRLSMQFVDSKEHVEETAQLLIQSRVLRELSNLKEDALVVIYAAEENKQVVFEQDTTIVVGRLIDAEFPDYAKILPSDHATKSSFEREALLKAVRICAIFARDTDDVIKLVLEKDKIVVSANTPQVGENSVEVEASLEGEENAIAFNAKYLLDFLTHINVKELTFEMQGPLNPGVFKIQDDDSFLHLIMPIRVQE